MIQEWKTSAKSEIAKATRPEIMRAGSPLSEFEPKAEDVGRIFYDGRGAWTVTRGSSRPVWVRALGAPPSPAIPEQLKGVLDENLGSLPTPEFSRREPSEHPEQSLPHERKANVRFYVRPSFMAPTPSFGLLERGSDGDVFIPIGRRYAEL